MSLTDRWIAELEGLPTSSDEGRGKYLVRFSSIARNLKHDNIAHLIRMILDSGSWRSFTYPNGDHYEFRAREFDYFLALQDIDPRIVRDAATYSADGEFRARLVEASLTEVGEDRRSVDEITATYPRLSRWLDKYGLRTLGPQKAYQNETARANVAAGVDARGAGRSGVELRVQALDRAQLAKKVADRLRSDPDLLTAVLDHLSETGAARKSVTPSVTTLACSECGTPIRRGKTCSQVCRNKRNSRTASA